MDAKKLLKKHLDLLLGNQYLSDKQIDQLKYEASINALNEVIESMNSVKVKTQKVYTFPDRKLYGEFCSLSLTELRLQIAKGEISEQLCYIDENDSAYLINEYGTLEDGNGYKVDSFIENIQTRALHTMIKAQFEKRRTNEKV